MVPLVIENAFLITLDSGKVIEKGSVLIEDGRITGVGPSSEMSGKVPDPARRIDAKGKIALPGFINTHHHLYSTFARGMFIPGEPAKDFVQILENLWWKLDALLDEEDIYLSSMIPLMECIRNGVTTIIDHHESQSFQKGSLTAIQKAVKKAGIRACLCLGSSDRYGKGKEGIKENERFLRSLSRKSASPGLVSGMVGLHASFTVGNQTLERSVELAREFSCGIHIHVAEDLADQEACLKEHGVRVVERLEKAGALTEKSLCVHCIHVDEKEQDILKRTACNVVHNPESNMNNAVGCADVLGMMKKGIEVGLGTDGMSSDMLAQMRCAYLIHRHNRRDPRVAFMEAPGMLLENNASIVSRVMGLSAGRLAPGFAGDVVLLDYVPPTPLNGSNVLGHLIFGMVDAAVDTTVCNGKVLMRNKKFTRLDEQEIAARSREQAGNFWKKINS